MRWLIAAGVISLVVGCGYQIAAPKVQLDLAVVVADRSLETDMQKALEQALVDPSVDQSDTSNRWQLTLLEERYQKVPIAVAAFEDMAEFELVLSWVVSLENPSGDLFIDQEVFTVREHFTRDNRRLVAAYQAEKALKAPLQMELVRRIGYRIEAVMKRTEK